MAVTINGTSGITTPGITNTGNEIVAGNETVTGDITGSSFNGGQLAGNRNKIINGAMNVWQRGTSFTNTANSYQYTADRWFVFSGVGLPATSGQVSTGRQDFPYALRVQRPSGNTSTSNTTAGQVIESVNCQYLAGQTVTVSFYARAGSNYSTASNALTAYVITGAGTDQGAANLINSAWTSQANTQNPVTLTTSFAKYTFSAAIPAGTNEVAIFFLTSPTGTAGANDYFDVTGIQLEPGATATPFENRLYGTELALCQRYFQINGAAGGNLCVSVGQATSASAAEAAYVLPVVMRAVPSLTIPAGATWTFLNAGGTGGVGGTIAVSGSSCPGIVSFNLTGASGLVAGNASKLLVSYHGFLLSAEL